MTLDDQFNQLAAAQHGVVSRDQARLLGFTRNMIRHRLGSGRWTRETAAVVGVAGAPSTRSRTAMVGVLDAGAGAIASHATAAAVWRVPGFTLEPIHVLQPRGGLQRRTPDGIVHTCRLVPPHHVKVLDGLPLSSPTRMIFDVAGMPGVSGERVAKALDNAWARRLTSGDVVHDMFDELRRRGRPGISLMREVLAERGREYVPPESNLERRFHKLLADDGQPPMRPQVNLGGDTWLARVDAYDDEARVVAQINSDRYHRALIDQGKDAAQNAALEALGFTIESITEHEVWYEGRRVQQRMRQARAEGRRRHTLSILQTGRRSA